MIYKLIVIQNLIDKRDYAIKINKSFPALLQMILMQLKKI